MQHSEELNHDQDKTAQRNVWFHSLYTNQEGCIEEIIPKTNPLHAPRESLPLPLTDFRKVPAEDSNQGAIDAFGDRSSRRHTDVGSFCTVETEVELFHGTDLDERLLRGVVFRDTKADELRTLLSDCTTTGENGSSLPLVSCYQQPRDVDVNERQMKKTRWRPNPQQFTLLSRHFNSGYTKATAELVALVKSAGEATEAQVAVWLKNKLARSTRQNKPSIEGHNSCGLETLTTHRKDGHCLERDYYNCAVKRFKGSMESFQNQSVDSFDQIFRSVLEEVNNTLASVNSDQVGRLVSEILNRKRICCYGVGRELCIIRALATRLHQTGIEAYLVGEINTPEVGPRDLLIASAGPGYFNSVNAYCLAAIKAGAKVVVLTAHETAPIQFADIVVRVPIANSLNPLDIGLGLGLRPSSECGRNLLCAESRYESSLWMLCECVCLLLQRRMGRTETEMVNRMTSLER